MQTALKIQHTERPEHLIMLTSIMAGETTWDDYSFEQRTYKGWLWAYLLDIDQRVGSQRWNYWIRTLNQGSILDEPIPQINFGTADSNVMSMLRKCLEHHCCLMHSAGHREFFDWILWGFGEGEERPKIDDKVNEHWYRTFNFGIMIQAPHDYLGEIISEAKAGRTYWNNPNAFFPTPHSIVKMMVLMNFGGFDSQGKDTDRDKHALSVCDPCVGTGRMLMEASNFSLNLFGVDIDLVCVKACKINAYLYVPWLARSAGWLGNTSKGIIQGDSLKMGFSTKADKPEPKILINAERAKLFAL